MARQTAPDGWTRALAALPEDLRSHVARVHETGGVLSAHVVARLVEEADIDVPTLMIRLLPLAAELALVPISNYKVGAVAQGMPTPNGASNLYFGANVEIANDALVLGAHAEQAATATAWLSGEEGLQSLAVSSAPCGYCRQFLYELTTQETLHVVLPTAGGYTSKPLSHYLPDAFGPRDLDVQGGLMNASHCTHALGLTGGSSDGLVQLALRAAASSYAPYTQNFAGCAVLSGTGNRYGGRYAENAAYNPSMSPLASALTHLNVSEPPGRSRVIQRAVLVEVPTKASQRGITAQLLASFAPAVALEYHRASLS